ncbi:MAG: cytochrome c maturation protein CcmE domain-containing protein [Candidatus Hodarchaeales archaeon]|jgi:cytochrome c-type biogenesis protein CcmE
MTKPQNLLMAGTVATVCIVAIFFLLASSSIPIFSVGEIMDHSHPDSYLNKRIQLVGIVQNSNGSHFSLYDPDDPTNASLIIYVEAINVEKPVGFEVDKMVLVEGKLLDISDDWTFKASMISTKCPSKYQN